MGFGSFGYGSGRQFEDIDFNHNVHKDGMLMEAFTMRLVLVQTCTYNEGQDELNPLFCF